jgi:tetratricopeptide (TPR) repeat protein
MVVVDTVRFEHQVACGTPEALQEAVALYHGELLEGFSVNEPTFEDWVRTERERLRSKAIDAMNKVLAHNRRQKAFDHAIQVGIRLLALEPFDEAVHRTMMALYAETGRRSAALQQYEHCVEVLSRELNTEPEAETRELYRRLVAERSTKTAAISRPQPKPTSRVRRAQGPDRPPAATPLIGREADLGSLDTLWRHAQQGRPQLALIEGEAGIGKSRLVDELATRAQRRSDAFLLGRGREGEDVLPLAPWVEALRPVLSKPLLGQLAPVTRLDLARLFPEIGDGPSPPPSGIEEGPRIFEAVANLLRLLATEQAVILVIEDLHWCDDMTVRLLRFLPRRLEGQPVLLMGTARPEDLADAPHRTAPLDVLRRDPSCAARTLSPLSRVDVRDLFLALASRADAPSEALVDRVWAISEGNPFVVVECARAVRELPPRDRVRVLDLPEGVRTLTTRSLARLSEGASRLADVAAVIGRDVDVRVLQHAACVTQGELADGLEELVRRRILRTLDGRFDFGHDRIREVAYGRLIEPRRVLLHQRIGEAIEAVYGANLAQHYAILATHYREAGDWPRACRYHAHAGFAARDRGAMSEALACFEFALDALSRVPNTEEWRELDVRLRLAINNAGMLSGSYERGRPHLLHAERVAKTLADPRWEGRVARAICSCIRAGGESEAALTFGRKALRIAVDTGDRPLEVAAKSILATSEFQFGNFRQALEHIEPLISEPGSSWGDRGDIVARPEASPTLSRYWTVLCCIQLGEFDRARRLVYEGLRLLDFEADVLHTRALFLHITHGRLLNAVGDFEGAIRAYESGVAMYREDCHGNFYGPLAWGLGLAYALAGRVRDSLEQFERAEAVALRLGSNSFAGTRLLHLGRALVAADQLDDASDTARKALSVSTKNGERPGEAGALGLLAEVAMDRDPLAADEMENHLLSALALAEPLEMLPLVARCHLRLGWLYSKMGRADGAAHCAAAESLLGRMGRPRSLDAAGVYAGSP